MAILVLLVVGSVRAGAEPLYILTDLGTPPGYTTSEGNAVNAAGQVAGTADTATGTNHAFLSGPGGGPLQDLGTLPGGTFSVGYAINAAGRVAGTADTVGGATHAFLSGPGGGPLQDLGTLGGTSSFGFGINASGWVAGNSNISTGAVHAFLYGDGRMLDLNDLIPAGSGFTLVSARSINDAGQITGIGGRTSDAAGHAFLLTPVPEPSSLALACLGGLVLLGYGGWRRVELHHLGSST